MQFYNGNGYADEDRLIVFMGRVLFEFDFEDEVVVLQVGWGELEEFIKAAPENEFWCKQSDFQGASFPIKKKDMKNLRFRCVD